MTIARVKESLATFGPGLVLALTITGPGDLVSNSASGAQYGYAMLWALFVGIAVRYTLLHAVAKYVLVTEETMLEGYGRVGRWSVWFILAAAVLRRHTSNLYLSLLLGSSIHLLAPLPTQASPVIWSFVFITISFVMVYWGGYPIVERLCKALMVGMGAGFVLIAVLSKPDLGEVIRGSLVPYLPAADETYGSFLMLTALIGGTAGSLSNVFYAYLLREKGWRDISALPNQRIDLFASMAFALFVGFAIQVSAAATIGNQGVELEDAEDMVSIFSGVFGTVGTLVFGLGFWAAVFSSYVGANMGYPLLIVDIYRKFIQRSAHEEPPSRNDPVFRWLVIFFHLSPLYIFLTGARPVFLVLLVSSLIVVVLPVVAIVLLILTSNRKLMGDHVNGWFANASLGLVALFTLFLSLRNGWELVTGQ